MSCKRVYVWKRKKRKSSMMSSASRWRGPPCTEPLSRHRREVIVIVMDRAEPLPINRAPSPQPASDQRDAEPTCLLHTSEIIGPARPYSGTDDHSARQRASAIARFRHWCIRPPIASHLRLACLAASHLPQPLSTTLGEMDTGLLLPLETYYPPRPPEGGARLGVVRKPSDRVRQAVRGEQPSPNHPHRASH